MKKLLLLTTGGTIASKRSAEGLKPLMTSEELLSFVPQVKEFCEVTTTQVINIDSTNIQPEHWTRIALEIGNRQISRRIKKHLWLSNRSWARDVHSFGILHSWGALAGKSCSAQASSIWLIAGAFRRTQSK